MILNLIEKFALGKYGKWFGLICRLTLGGVLFAAGWLKIFTPAKSQMAVRAYEVLPIGLANFLGIFLPWFEVGLGVLLILGNKKFTFFAFKSNLQSMNQFNS